MRSCMICICLSCWGRTMADIVPRRLWDALSGIILADKTCIGSQRGRHSFDTHWNIYYKYYRYRWGMKKWGRSPNRFRHEDKIPCHSLSNWLERFQNNFGRKHDSHDKRYFLSISRLNSKECMFHYPTRRVLCSSYTPIWSGTRSTFPSIVGNFCFQWTQKRHTC